MDNKLLDQLIYDLKELTKKLGDKKAKSLDLLRLERIIKRLNSFASDCNDCKRYLTEMINRVENLKSKHGQLEKQDIKEHRRMINQVISHLQKEHKLITEGYYMSTYMAIGICVGYTVGLLLFENYVMGTSLGFILGVAIGTSMDSNAKKKGLTI